MRCANDPASQAAASQAERVRKRWRETEGRFNTAVATGDAATSVPGGRRAGGERPASDCWRRSWAPEGSAGGQRVAWGRRRTSCWAAGCRPMGGGGMGVGAGPRACGRLRGRGERPAGGGDHGFRPEVGPTRPQAPALTSSSESQLVSSCAGHGARRLPRVQTPPHPRAAKAPLSHRLRHGHTLSAPQEDVARRAPLCPCGAPVPNTPCMRHACQSAPREPSLGLLHATNFPHGGCGVGRARLFSSNMQCKSQGQGIGGPEPPAYKHPGSSPFSETTSYIHRNSLSSRASPERTASSTDMLASSSAC